MSLVNTVRSAAIVARANTSLTERPDRLPRAVIAALRHGSGTLGAVAASCHRYPDVVAIVSGEQQLTYRELWTSSQSLACSLADAGLGPGSRIGVLCRNSPFFAQSVLAGLLLGADLVFLNTALGKGQLAEVAKSEGLDGIVHDDEAAGAVRSCLVPTTISHSEAMSLIDRGMTRSLSAPTRPSTLVILTSGTTGRPKGAARSSRSTSEGIAAVLGRVPVRLRDTVVIPAPFFHAWGLAHLLIGLGVSATVVTHPRFDAEATMRSVAEREADGLVAVPSMLQDVCALNPQMLAEIETRSLRFLALSGSALPGRLATELLDRFGPILYNVYGSTEVATATIAGPGELRRSPTTSGRAAPGIRVEILDGERSPLPHGETGWVFVGNAARFDGYTSGGSKETVRGLVSTGDLGHFDRRGQLFLDGREDDMIVSGGENVYPSEVEEALNNHVGVQEAVVVPMADTRLGQALRAVVVTRSGHTLESDALKDYLTHQLATFKVPRVFDFVDELPRNATGKVLRRSL